MICKTCKHYQGKKRIPRPNFVSCQAHGYDWVHVCAYGGMFEGWKEFKRCTAYQAKTVVYPVGGSEADILKMREV